MPRAAWAMPARQPPREAGEEPVSVLVTGFGPFLEKFPRNTSWEIASSLPALLPATTAHPTPIHIHVYHAPIRVAYHPVQLLVPKLLSPTHRPCPNPDIILHIGLAAGRQFYTLEKGSYRNGYDQIPDVDGHKFLKEETDKSFPSSSYPPILRTSFDTSDVLKRWRSNVPKEHDSRESPMTKDPYDVRLSSDAGNFLCGFVYWNSLAHYFEIKEDERPVAFLHVPDLSYSEDALERGREVAIALIRALVESRRENGVVDSGSSGALRTEDNDDVRAKTDVNFKA